jgi:hypothetical protein
MNEACELCRALGATVAWGESMEEPLPDDPPAQLRRLERVSDEILRCPLCGNLYEHGTASQSFLNNDYDSEYVRRLRPNAYPSQEAGQAALQRMRSDLDGADVAARVAAANTLAGSADYLRELVESKHPDVRRVAAVSFDNLFLRDISALRPGLTAMLDDSDPFVRRRAATFLIQKSQDAAGEISSLMEWPQPEVRLVAMEHLALQDVTPFEHRLRALTRHPDWPEMRRAASEILTKHLLKTPKRRGEAMSLLETSTGEALNGALKGFVDTAPDRAMELMPQVERALRSRSSMHGAEDVLVALLADPKSRAGVLREIAALQKSDPRLRIPPDVRQKLAELLADSDEDIRDVAWKIFTTMAERGGVIASTLTPLAKKLGCTNTSPRAVVTEMIHNDIETTPLIRWLALLSYTKPDEALDLLRDLHERGQDIEVAVDALQRLSKTTVAQKAKSLLDAVNSPEARERLQQFADLAAGHLIIGGGQAPEWLLYTKDGQFFIEHRFGDHGDAQSISGNKVRSILARKAYTWQERR